MKFHTEKAPSRMKSSDRTPSYFAHMKRGQLYSCTQSSCFYFSFAFNMTCFFEAVCVCKFLPQRFFTKVRHQDVHIAMQSSKLLLSQLTTVTRIQHPIKCHPESHPSTQPIPAFVFSEFPYPQVVAGPFDPTLRSMAVPSTRL